MAERERHPEQHAAELAEQARDKELFLKNRKRKQEMAAAVGLG